MNINQLTATRIKELRAKSGLTAEAVAQNLDISRGAYSQMENGHIEITLSRIEMLAQIFNVPVGEIIPTSTTNHQTFTDNKGGNYGNVVTNNTTHNTHNFFTQNEEILKTLFETLKATFESKQNDQ